MSKRVTQARIDEYLEETRRKIDEYGIMIQAVFADEAEPIPFAYTAGLARVGQPELICFGLGPTSAQAILNDLGFRMLGRKRHVRTEGDVTVYDGQLQVRPGDTIHHLVRDYPVKVVRVNDSWQHLTVANRLFGNPDGCLPALQLVFPDDEGLFPWEPGSAVEDWPVLGGVEEGREITLEDAS